MTEAIQFISHGVNSGRNVLVHCQLGVSRSAAIVIGYLMNKHKVSYDSAHNMVQIKRAVIDPNFSFVAQLRLFEDMGCDTRICGNRPQFRRKLISKYFDGTSPYDWRGVHKIDRFFDELYYYEVMTESLYLGNDCLCAKCGHKLFNEIHIIRNTGSQLKSNSSKTCDYTYIEPQKWMKQLTAPTDVWMTWDGVKCPQCGEQLIEFKKLFDSYSCDCPQHSSLAKCLRFRIKSKKFRIHSKE